MEKQQRITEMLNELGMTSEDLYHLLFGKSQEVTEEQERAVDAVMQVSASGHEIVSAEDADLRMELQEMLADLDTRKDRLAIAEELKNLLGTQISLNGNFELMSKERYAGFAEALHAFFQSQKFDKLMQIMQAHFAVMKPQIMPLLKGKEGRASGTRILAEALTKASLALGEAVVPALATYGLTKENDKNYSFVQPLKDAVVQRPLQLQAEMKRTLTQAMNLQAVIEEPQRKPDQQPAAEPVRTASKRRDIWAKLRAAFRESQGRNSQTEKLPGHTHHQDEKEFLAKADPALANKDPSKERDKERSHNREVNRAFIDHKREMGERKMEAKERDAHKPKTAEVKTSIQMTSKESATVKVQSKGDVTPAQLAAQMDSGIKEALAMIKSHDVDAKDLGRFNSGKTQEAIQEAKKQKGADEMRR